MAHPCDWEGCFEDGVKRVKKWEQTGRSNSVSGWMNNHGGRGARGGTRSTRGNQYYWYCREHYLQYLGQEKAKGRGCFFLIVLAVGAFIAYALLHPSTKRHSATSTISTATSAVTSEVSDAAHTVADEPVASHEVEERSDPAIDTPPEEAASAIQAATLKALDSGSPQRWHKSHWRGYASVSAVQEISGKECRNAYATEEHKETKLTTPTVQWCREPGGDWSPT